jgi:hypothetical protein
MKRQRLAKADGGNLVLGMLSMVQSRAVADDVHGLLLYTGSRVRVEIRTTIFSHCYRSTDTSQPCELDDFSTCKYNLPTNLRSRRRKKPRKQVLGSRSSARASLREKFGWKLG